MIIPELHKISLQTLIHFATVHFAIWLLLLLVAKITADAALQDGNSCQTKIEVNQGQVNVDRECKQTLACQNNMANNPAICYSADAIAKGVSSAQIQFNDANAQFGKVFQAAMKKQCSYFEFIKYAKVCPNSLWYFYNTCFFFCRLESAISVAPLICATILRKFLLPRLHQQLSRKLKHLKCNRCVPCFVRISQKCVVCISFTHTVVWNK